MTVVDLLLAFGLRAWIAGCLTILVVLAACYAAEVYRDRP